MIASDLKLTQGASFIELSARVRFERFPFHTERIWWRFPLEYAEYLHLSGDPLLPALLLPCMFKGERLVIEAPVSEQLLTSVPKIQALFCEWFKEVKEIVVTAPILKIPISSGMGVGCFFSGGVDSFYSLLKNEAQSIETTQRITHLLLINGFDIKLKHKELYHRLQKHTLLTADALGKSLLEVSTNLKPFGDKYLLWDYYHGSVLASVGLALGALFQKLIIPSSYSREQLFPFGSHPELDVLWSTERTMFEHDGCETPRVEKVVNYLSHSQLALNHLRVCWRNRNVFYNCGACEKCLRTMIALYIGTGRTEFPIFSKPLDPDAIQHIKLKKSNEVFVQENLKALNNKARPTEFDQRLIEALRKSVGVCLEKF